jgi:hypothetical protein
VHPGNRREIGGSGSLVEGVLSDLVPRSGITACVAKEVACG